ncbi:MAG: hypothetical protein KGS72_08685 [Cyanobacteria bacterium REEB67]|nr:hypothetical protein [Cyanobacteria bacterium REEB67]
MPWAALLYVGIFCPPLCAQETTDGSMIGPDQSPPPVVPPAVNQAAAALNIQPPATRQPIPPPPETPQAGQVLTLQKSNLAPSLPQAWRLKALLLFKPNSNLDKNSIAFMRVASPYRSTFAAIRKILNTNNITIDAWSSSSGHILLSSPNEKGGVDRAILALKQGADGGNNDGNAWTDLRVFCDKNNRALTLAQLKSALSQLDATILDQNSKPDADSL